jgi:fluoride exporter
MNSLISVMLGGAIGAGLRYGAALMVDGRLPWATLGVNLLGSFLMGLLMALIMRGSASEGVRLFVGVGILGGFTTFSTFSFDLWQMMERGQAGIALGYALISVIGSVVLLVAAMSLGRAIS